MKLSKKLIDFENKINEYFLKCEQKATYPDEAGLILHLGLSKKTYEKHRDNTDGKHAGFSRALCSARLRRESVIVRDLVANGSGTGKMFVARQPSNGGLNDKPRDEPKKVTFEVLIGGESAGQFE